MLDLARPSTSRLAEVGAAAILWNAEQTILGRDAIGADGTDRGRRPFILVDRPWQGGVKSMSFESHLAPSPCDRPRDSQAPSAPGRNGAVSSVLVVDDDRDTVEAMACLLRLFGHDVCVASDGHQAIEVARRVRPNCIVLDVGLPGLNGYEVAATLRRELSEPVVLIAVTGYGREEDRHSALVAGFDHHFLKPLHQNGISDLLAVLGTGPRSGSPAPGPAASEQDGRRLGEDFPIPGLMAPSANGCEDASMLLVSRQVEVTNPLGLHLRVADQIVRLTQRFRAEVRVTCDGRTASARSILELATLAAACGSRLELEADGPEAEAAVVAVIALLANGSVEPGQ
jgi:phosphotransferase system HPr (HPr) family protein